MSETGATSFLLQEDLTILSETVDVWTVSISSSPELLDRVSPYLSREEQARFGRFRIEEDRIRGALGRGLVRVLLGGYLDTAPAKLEFENNAQGKPLMTPAFAKSAIHFNVAHAGDLVMIAIARGWPVGVDVESTTRSVAHEKLAQRYFAPEEVDALMAVPEEERRSAFLRCWTRKEAYLKARGEGLFRSLDSFLVTPLDAERCSPRLRDVDSNTVAPWEIIDLGLDPGHVGAVALRAQGSSVRYRYLRGIS